MGSGAKFCHVDDKASHDLHFLFLDPLFPSHPSHQHNNIMSGQAPTLVRALMGGGFIFAIGYGIMKGELTLEPRPSPL